MSLGSRRRCPGIDAVGWSGAMSSQQQCQERPEVLSRVVDLERFLRVSEVSCGHALRVGLGGPPLRVEIERCLHHAHSWSRGHPLGVRVPLSGDGVDGLRGIRSSGLVTGVPTGLWTPATGPAGSVSANCADGTSIRCRRWATADGRDPTCRRVRRRRRVRRPAVRRRVGRPGRCHRPA